MNRLKLTISCLAALATLGVSANAFALDGYQDRRGVFAGLGLGGGVGLVQTDESGETTGIDGGRKLGMHMSAMFGGGATKNLVIAGEANWWARSVYIDDDSLRHHHLSFNAVANLFLFNGFYLEGGGGLAYAIFDAQRAESSYRYQELGLALKGGAGVEFFLNSQIAMGMRVGYTRHMYNNADFDTIAGGLTLRWY